MVGSHYVCTQPGPLWEIRVPDTRGAWVAQLFGHPTLDFSSGHDLGVVGSSPVSDAAFSGESAGDSPSAPSPTLSLSQINNF